MSAETSDLDTRMAAALGGLMAIYDVRHVDRRASRSAIVLAAVAAAVDVFGPAEVVVNLRELATMIEGKSDAIQEALDRAGILSRPGAMN